MMLNGAKRNKPIKGGRASPIGGINEDVRKKKPDRRGGLVLRRLVWGYRRSGGPRGRAEKTEFRATGLRGG